MLDFRGLDQPHSAVHCEMQDVANESPLPSPDLTCIPAAASVELAKLLHKYDLHIHDDDRATLIILGGRLLQVGRAIDVLAADNA